MKRKTPKPISSKRSGPVTLSDVAKRAEVHLSTVSRVLNPAKRKMVSDDVSDRIRLIAKEMGYRANPFGYGLRTNKSNTIGVVIPDLANPMFPPIIRGIEHTLRKAGYTAIFADSDEDIEEEHIIIDQMKARQVEGLILATAHRDDTSIDETLAEEIPTVLINRATDNNRVLSVTNDDFCGAQLAMDHLIKLGHTQIAHLAGPKSLSTGHERQRGYLAALERHNIKPSDDLIIACEAFGFADGKKGFEELLERKVPFTAVFAGNDFLALGCYHAMKKHGISCPDDISIVGYNDMPFSDMFQPALTTVRIDMYEMGNRAAGIILNIIDDSDDTLEPVILDPELIIRESTIPLKV